MLSLPPDPASGENIREWAVRLSAVLRRILPRDSDDIWHALSPGGCKSRIRRSRGGEGSATRAEIKHPFQCYRSPYVGGGSEPPEDQVFRIRIRVGPVKNLFPENINQEWVCPPSSTTIFWVAGSFNSEGTLLSVTIDCGAAVPEDPSGSEDNAPNVSRRPLFRVTTDADGITKIEQFVQHPLDVTPIVRAVTCEGNILAYFWGETLFSYVSAPAEGGD